MGGLKAAEWDGICIRHDDADQRGGSLMLKRYRLCAYLGHR